MTERLILTPESIITDQQLTANDIRLYLLILSLMTNNEFIYNLESFSKRFNLDMIEVATTISVLAEKNYFTLTEIEKGKTKLQVPENSTLSKFETKIVDIEKNKYSPSPNKYILLLRSSNIVCPSPIRSNLVNLNETIEKENNETKQYKPRTITGTTAVSNSVVSRAGRPIPKYVKSLRGREIKIEHRESKIKVTKEEQEIIDKWNKLGFREFYIRDTKIFANTIQSIKSLKSGVLFKKDKKLENHCRKYTQEEILSTMDNLANAFERPEDYNLQQKDLIRLRKNTLGDFIYNPYSPYKSEFVRFLDETLIDDNKEITNILKRFYIRKVLGGITPENDFSFYENSKFIEAGKRIHEFYEKNKSRLRLIRSLKDFTTIVCEALASDIQDISIITPGYFSSDITFNRRIPVYLNKQGILMEKKSETRTKIPQHI